jgi:hypothetical protein
VEVPETNEAIGASCDEVRAIGRVQQCPHRSIAFLVGLKILHRSKNHTQVLLKDTPTNRGRKSDGETERETHFYAIVHRIERRDGLKRCGHRGLLSSAEELLRLSRVQIVNIDSSGAAGGKYPRPLLR